MEILGDETYIYTTHFNVYYTIIIVQNGKGELVELQIEQYYE
jgi:hypothetical protein